MLNLITGEINCNSVWEDLERMLDSVDADFTGTNGLEYYTENGISQIENAINQARIVSDKFTDQIVHVLESCKEYSSNYYDDFKYQILDNNDFGNDIYGWYVIIATNTRR